MYEKLRYIWVDRAGLKVRSVKAITNLLLRKISWQGVVKTADISTAPKKYSRINRLEITVYQFMSVEYSKNPL